MNLGNMFFNFHCFLDGKNKIEPLMLAKIDLNVVVKKTELLI